MKKNKNDLKCPCNSSKTYANCCKQFIEENKIPKNAEQLMRSRYSAYSLAKIDYIQKTMKGDALEKFNFNDSLNWAKSVKFCNLKILKNWDDQNDNKKSYVEFIAYFKVNGKMHTLHEISEFTKLNDQWFYTNTINQ